jgi:hypothetical protein
MAESMSLLSAPNRMRSEFGRDKDSRLYMGYKYNGALVTVRPSHNITATTALLLLGTGLLLKSNPEARGENAVRSAAGPLTDNRRIGVRFAAVAREFFLLLSVQTSGGSHASDGCRDFFSRG